MPLRQEYYPDVNVLAGPPPGWQWCLPQLAYPRKRVHKTQLVVDSDLSSRLPFDVARPGLRQRFVRLAITAWSRLSLAVASPWDHQGIGSSHPFLVQTRELKSLVQSSRSIAWES